MIVDLHANLYHPSWYPKVFRESVVNEFMRRQAAEGRAMSRRRADKTLESLLQDRDGSRTLRLMDKVGIDKKAIMIMDWGLALGEADKSIREVNKEILGVCASAPDRLMGFAGVDPRRPDARDTLLRSMDDWGAAGLKLHPTTGWRLHDETAHEIVGLAVERQLPILIHIGTTIEELSDAHARPSDIAALARQFPGGTFIAGHAGFERWTEFTEIDNLPANLHCDISGWQAIVGSDASKLEHHLFGLLEVFPGRVHFGTDGPFYSYNLPASEQHWLQMVIACLNARSDLSKEERSSVLESVTLLGGPGATGAAARPKP